MSLVGPTRALLPNISTGKLAGIAAGVAIGVGALSALTTRTDGTRYVHRRYGSDYHLQPTSKDAARSSISFQRTLGGLGAAAGGALTGFTMLNHAPGKDARWVLLGAGLLGGSVGRLLKLSHAEEHLNEALPEHTAPGQAEMVRRNAYAWASDGAGYSASGIYQGQLLGPNMFAKDTAPAPWDVSPVPAATSPYAQSIDDPVFDLRGASTPLPAAGGGLRMETAPFG
jgi:hypothetical protein